MNLLSGQKLRLTLMSSILIVASFVANAATPESVPGEYIVKLKEQSSVLQMAKSRSMLESQLGAHVKNIIKADHLVVVQRATMETVESAVSSLRQSPLVEYVEPNYIYHITRSPNQVGYVNLWGLHNVGQIDTDGNAGTPGVDIGAEKAWDITTGSDSVLVAVIDTGIDYTHPDLAQNAWVNPGETGTDSQGKNKANNGIDDDSNGYVDDVHGFSFADTRQPTNDPLDDHGHGSHCSGTIGGYNTSGQGIVGVNWKVKIVGVKFLDSNGSGSLEGAVMAIDYATKVGAKVMSNSWGGGGFSQTLQDAIARANKAGALFVAAAGNESSDNDQQPAYPATLPVENIVSVAAIDNQGSLAGFSNFGAKTVHLAAPGVNIYSSVKGGGYDTWSGTSMATPHVSGVAALLISHEPSLNNMQLKKRLMATTRALPALSGKSVSGGMVNAYNALVNNTAEAAH